MNLAYQLMQATANTLALAISACLVGLLIAMLFTWWESCRYKSVAMVGATFTTLLRGLPEILVILFIYFGTLQVALMLADGIDFAVAGMKWHWQLSSESLTVSPFFCGVMALAMLYAAYASQTFRGALQAIPLGQYESGRALGMRPLAIFTKLILPQMWRHALPGLGNQWLVLLKDTALVSLISVNDLMLQTKIIANRTLQPFTWYLIAALIYLIITLFSQAILRRVERRVTHFENEQV